MPAAVKLQAEYGDELQVIFVHSQKGTDQQIVRRQLERGWLGNQAMWTNEYPFRTNAGGLPNFALLDAEGRVVMHGISTRLMKQMEDKIAELVKTAEDAPESVPKPLAKAYESMQAGEYAKALAVFDKQIEKPSGGKAEIAEAAAKLRGELVERANAHMARIDWMLDHGYAEAGAEALDDFVKAAKKIEFVQEGVAALKEKLGSDEMKAELAAAGDLAKIERKIYEDPKGKHRRSLERFLEKHGGTQAAKRAEFWLDKIWE